MRSIGAQDPFSMLYEEIKKDIPCGAEFWIFSSLRF